MSTEKPSNDGIVWKSNLFFFFGNHHKISNDKTKRKPPFQHNAINAIDPQVIESANLITEPRPWKNDISEDMMDKFGGKIEILGFELNGTN